MATLAQHPVLAPPSGRVDDLLLRICRKLQLSQTQHEQAKQSYEAICRWLDADDSALRFYKPQLFPQGSVALQTTVKPLSHEEYDVDLVCQMEIDGYSLVNPIVLLDMIESRLREHYAYAQLIERKNRCIRVNYERQFHLDILPACPDHYRGGTCLLIPDRELQDFSKTNPKGFQAWFAVQSMKRRSVAFDEIAKASAAPLPEPQAAHQKRPLQLAVQLMKRWRDIHYANMPDFAPVSIVLTTLAGMNYRGDQSILEALDAIISGTITSIPSYGRLKVCNPANNDEDLSDRWNDNEAYQAFVRGMYSLHKSIRELQSASDIVEASKLIKQLFGEEITKRVFDEQLREVDPARNSGALGVTRTAVLGSLLGSATVPVRANTFYGD